MGVGVFGEYVRYGTEPVAAAIIPVKSTLPNVFLGAKGRWKERKAPARGPTPPNPTPASTKSGLGSRLVVIVEAGVDDADERGPLRAPFRLTLSRLTHLSQRPAGMRQLTVADDRDLVGAAGEVEKQAVGKRAFVAAGGPVNDRERVLSRQAGHHLG